MDAHLAHRRAAHRREVVVAALGLPLAAVVARLDREGGRRLRLATCKVQGFSNVSFVTRLRQCHECRGMQCVQLATPRFLSCLGRPILVLSTYQVRALHE